MNCEILLNIGIALGWFGLHYYYNINYLNDNKLAGRVVSYNHATLSVIFSGIALYNPTIKNIDTVYYNSVGYFIYESGYQLLKKNTLLRNAFILHHIAAIYTLTKLYVPEYNTLILLSLLNMELSNIPSYFVYFIRKRHPNFKYRSYFELGQAVIYSGLRLITGTYLIKRGIELSEDKFLTLLCGSVYLMGVVWSRKLWMALLNKKSRKNFQCEQ